MMDRGEILEGARPQNEAYEGLKHQVLSLDIEPGEMLRKHFIISDECGPTADAGCAGAAG